MESDGHARSTCGVREPRQPPVRRSVRQRAAAARRPTSIVCWWQSGDAGGAADRRRALAPTGHRAAACDQHDTRRHTATSLMLMLLLRPAAAAPASYGVIANPRHRKISARHCVKLNGAHFPRARARQSRAPRCKHRATCWRRRWRQWVPTHKQVPKRLPQGHDSGWGRTMELGRSGRMPMMMVWSPRRRWCWSAAPGERSEVPGLSPTARSKSH